MIDVMVTLAGARPLIMHNVRLADPRDQFAKQLKALSGTRTKTDDVYDEMAEAEFLGGLYWHADTGPYIPGENVFASLVEGARMSKQGRAVERGVLLGIAGDRN